MATAKRKPSKAKAAPRKKPAAKKKSAPLKKQPVKKASTRKKSSARKKSAADRAEAFLRKAALDYPEAYEEFPWGERAIKVNKKIFAFINRREDDGGCSLTVKLPESAREALLLPCSEPTHYGMGKYGWVTMRFAADEEPPIGLLVDWIDESYRAIAPKKLVAALDAE